MSIPSTALANTPQHAKNGLQALYEGGHVPNKLAGVDPLHILARYLSDETSKDIAKSYGCTVQALSHFLILNACNEWQQAQVARAIARKDEADQSVRTAPDALELARAREQLRSAQWDLERLLSRLYGQKQEVQHTVAPVLHIHLAQDVVATPLTIDHNAVADAQVIDNKQD